MHEQGGRSWPFLVVAGAVPLLAIALVRIRWLDVVEVEGRSMAPALLPGDRLLVESLTYRRRAPRRREVVLAPDPRLATRELIKRVHAAGPELDLRGDEPGYSTDSRAFGQIPASQVRWRAVIRYWPPGRAGRVR